MEKTDNAYKLTHAQNLSKFNFNLTVSTNIDSNANIKTILDIKSYMFDCKVECGSGKALISGKVGIKIVYLDTDNMTNSISAFSNFNETYINSALTSDTYLDVNSVNIMNNILSTENILKVNCDVSILPIAYLNLGLSNNVIDTDCLFTKTKAIQSCSISKMVNTQFEYATNTEIKDSITKILNSENHLVVEKATAETGYIVVEGKILSCLLYETQNDNDFSIKENRETFNFKYDIQVDGVEKGNALDLSFCLDKSNENISTEIEDSMNIITTKHSIKVCGVVLKDTSIEVLEDAFSTTNEIEVFYSKRNLTLSSNNHTISEVVLNEITLQKDETAIEEIIGNLSVTPEITNTYIKDHTIFVEGIILSNLVYVDENKEIKLKPIEVPFIVNTKIEVNRLDCVHSNISILDSRVKVRRGTILEFEYSLYISLNIYQKEEYEMIDNYKLGKPITYGDYDYQIFIAKPEETAWDLCKRIKIAPTDLNKYNKNLPLICNGGEKIIIKR